MSACVLCTPIGASRVCRSVVRCTCAARDPLCYIVLHVRRVREVLTVRGM